MTTRTASTTDEESEWETAAAAHDGGKGLPLRECDPDGEDMSFVYGILKVQDFAAKKKDSKRMFDVFEKDG